MTKMVIVALSVGLMSIFPFTVFPAENTSLRPQRELNYQCTDFVSTQGEQPILIVSDQQKDVQIFKNFVYLNIHRTNYPKTGNFCMVLQSKLKDQTFRNQKIEELKEKNSYRQEYEKQKDQYDKELAASEGKYVPAPDHADMSKYLVTTGARKFSPDFLKYIKTIVYFDMQNKKMVNLREDYFDENGEPIAFVSGYQKITKLDSDPQINKLAYDIAAILEKESSPNRKSETDRKQQMQNLLNKMKKY